MTEEKEEDQETFTKDEVDSLVTEKLSEQEETFDAKIAEIKEEMKEELKPEEKPELKSSTAVKYVDESFGTGNNFTYNDLMAKVVEVVKEHVKPADATEVTKSVMDSLKQEEVQVKEESKQADEAWDNQVAELKKSEKLDDKTVTEILTKANKWNKENPKDLITGMKLAHEHWKKDEKEIKKPSIPGAPTNNADEESDEKIFRSTEEAKDYWLATHGSGE